MLKAIETVYNGYRFRSRLEARWAVFFDALGISYEYEKQGYDLGGVGPSEDRVQYGFYLPDFEVNRTTFVEIKPFFRVPLDDAEEKRFVQSGMLDALVQLPRLAELSGRDCFLIEGNPWPDEYRIHLFEAGDPYHQDTPRGVYEFRDCRRCKGVGLESVDDGGHVLSWVCSCENDRWKGNCPRESSTRVMAAYEAARSARFEHGESGAPQPVRPHLSDAQVYQLKEVYRRVAPASRTITVMWTFAREYFEINGPDVRDEQKRAIMTKWLDTWKSAYDAWYSVFGPAWEELNAQLREAGVDVRKIPDGLAE